MWGAYQDDHGGLAYDIALCRAAISKLSPDLKTYMNYVHKKCVPVWVEKKRAMKKEVRRWVDQLLVEWEDDEIQEIEGGLGPVSYNQYGEIENDDSGYESSDQDGKRTVSEMGEGAECGELSGLAEEPDELVKRTQSEIEDVVKCTEPDEPETKMRRMK